MAEAIHDVLAALPMPVLAVDGTERIVAANEAATALVGQGSVGRHYVTILRQPQLIDTIAAVLGDSQPRVSQYLSNNGIEDTTFRVTARALPHMRVLMLTFQDVSHLEQADQMRRDFVANVSHELRTLLTALMGFIETLRGPAREDAAARDRFLDIMEGEAGRMNRLVGDLLSLSRVEGDQRVRPQGRVNLDEIVSSVLRSLAPLANESSVRLTYDGPEQPVSLTGDADQLMQVVTNLVENAIKYGGSGGQVAITVTEVARDLSLRAPGVHLSITDFGPGIDPVHLPRLTERFYRADSHRSRALGGHRPWSCDRQTYHQPSSRAFAHRERSGAGGDIYRCPAA